MHNTLPTMAGRRFAVPPSRNIPEPALPSDPKALLLRAGRLDRDADAELAEGNTRVAERLAHLAYECRARAIGGRA